MNNTFNNTEEQEYNKFINEMNFKKPVNKAKPKNKFHNILISLILVCVAIFILLLIYEKALDIHQAHYDMKYKEVISSTTESPYECIYRRINKLTGETEVIVSFLDDGEWHSVTIPAVTYHK